MLKRERQRKAEKGGKRRKEAKRIDIRSVHLFASIKDYWCQLPI
jgi:hypothetical protein